MEKLDEVFSALSNQLGALRLSKQDHIFIDQLLTAAKTKLKDDGKTKLDTKTDK